jgi:cytochrome c oxidase assembly protein subunit 15
MTPSGAAEAAADGRLDAEVHTGKAWNEMIHRYGASLLGLLILAIAFVAVRARRHTGVPVALPLALVVLVIFQGMLGMWTVTLLLKPLIVTLHLAFGMLTLSMLWWLWLTLRRRSSNPWSGTLKARGGGSAAALFLPAPLGLRRLALVALIALAVQILLGGWTSTNYSAVACPDFPRCQGSWLPEADYGEAFVLWRGLGINYEGGVLNHPARVAIHFTHRLGAIVAALALLVAAVLTLMLRREGNSRLAAALVLAALALQLAFGIFMVLRGFPLWLATAHNAGAALLLLATLALNRALRRV